MKSFLTFALIAIACRATHAADLPTIRGRVIDDRNSNGQFDAGETGLAGVTVTDGVQFVLTGPDGAYELKMVEDPVIPFHPSRTVAVSWPSGRWPSSRWYARLADIKPDEPLNFALRPDEQKLPFTFAQSSDPHDNLRGDGSRRMRDDVAAMGDRVKFCVFTGDLGYASLEGADGMFRDIREFTRAFPVPMFHTVGNHDVVGIHTPSWSQLNELSGNGPFTKYVSPVRWSFTYAGIHIVGMDWMKIVGATLELGQPDVAGDWLDKDLSLLKPGTRTIFFSHCVDGNDRKFYDVAVKHKIELIMAGHSHRNLDISHRGIKAITVMNQRGPYRLANVTEKEVQIINRCTGCKDPSYHSKGCAMARGHKSGAVGTGSKLKAADIALPDGAKSVGQTGQESVEVLAVIDPGASKRCGLRLKPPGGAAPLTISLADNVLTAGDVWTSMTRRADQPLCDLRLFVEKGQVSLYACGRVQFDVPWQAAGPCEVEFFTEGGAATLKSFDTWDR